MKIILFNSNRLYIFFVLILNITVFAQTDTVSHLDITTRNFDQKHIKLTLSFDWNEQKVIGKNEFTFSPIERNFNRLVLHSKSTIVSSVTYEGVELEFTADDQHLYVDFPQALNPETDITIIIEYTAYPPKGLYFFSPTEKLPEMPLQIWTQGQSNNNRFWYPAYDLPDDRLTSEMIVTVPSELKAISNGELIETTDNNDGTKTFHWSMKEEYPNYLTTLIVGQYTTLTEVVRGVSIEYNVDNEWADRFDIFYGRTPLMMNFFSDLISPYPYERYAQTTVQDFEWGGMENVTSTTLNRRILHDHSASPNYTPDPLIAHELAHQWFGDYLTCKTWDHLWLNEGFATYFTDLWIEYFHGRDEFIVSRIGRNNNYTSSTSFENLKSKDSGIKNRTPVDLSGGFAYTKGAAILHMLRYELGDSLFFRGVNHYVNKFAHSSVVSEDFRISMEEVSGKNLKPFFDQWVYSGGFPVYEVSYNWNDDDNTLDLHVKQVQESGGAVPHFKQLIPIEIVAGNYNLKTDILVENIENTFQFKLSAKPDLVSFNRDETVVCVVKFNKSFEELSYQLLYDNSVAGRIEAAEKIREFNNAASVLVSALNRELNYSVKIKIIESLRSIGNEKAFEGVMIAVNDTDNRVREVAVRSLAHFNNKSVKPILSEIIRNEFNVYVKGAAAYSFGALKFNDSFDVLKNILLLDSHRNIIRRGAFEGLAILGDERAIELVAEYTQYKYSYGGMHLLDISAIDCLMTFADSHRDQVVSVLEGILSNPYFRTINYAVSMLVKLDSKNSLELLREFAKNERRLVVLNVIDPLIMKLETGN